MIIAIYVVTFLACCCLVAGACFVESCDSDSGEALAMFSIIPGVCLVALDVLLIAIYLLLKLF